MARLADAEVGNAVRIVLVPISSERSQAEECSQDIALAHLLENPTYYDQEHRQRLEALLFAVFPHQGPSFKPVLIMSLLQTGPKAFNLRYPVCLPTP